MSFLLNKSKVFIGGHNSSISLDSKSEIYIDNFFLKYGFKLTEPADADYFVCLDFLESDLKKVKNRIPVKNRILLRFEPKVVWPNNYSNAAFSEFGLIINMGRNSKSENNSIHWPQIWDLSKSRVLESKIFSDRLAVISGNKLSFISSELYSLRRKCIKNIDSIDLYGTRWNLNTIQKIKVTLAELYFAISSKNLPKLKALKYWFSGYPNWLGSPVDKFEVLGRYRQTLVIENSPEYLTEKLFDAFMARSIPIYVGPPVEDYGIPRNLVIQCEPNVDAILEGFNLAKKIDYQLWYLELENWIAMPETRANWSVEGVYEGLIQKIRNYLN